MYIRSIILAGTALAYAGTALAAQPAGGAERRPAAAPRLVAVVPSEELKAAMKPYGFKAYRYSDGTNTFQCLYAAPKARSSKGLPMVVYIPGNGERGDLVRQFRQRTLFDRVCARGFQERYPCHLLAISPPESVNTLFGGLPGEPNVYQRLMREMVLAVARQAVPKVDATRVYVTGFSYGGDGAYALALHYPGDFAAALPIAAVPPFEDLLSTERPPNIWDVYNEGDGVASSRANAARKRFRERANAAGGDVRMSTFPVTGHDAWTKAWREDEIWDWMFSKSLDRPSAGACRKASPVRALPVRASLADAKCTASVDGRDAASGPSRALDGLDETAYIPARGFRKADWWRVEFAQPVSGKVCIYSGARDGSDRLVGALAEISSNGRTWRRMSSFSTKDGTCSFTSRQAFSFLRVRPLDDKPRVFALRRVTLESAAR